MTGCELVQKIQQSDSEIPSSLEFGEGMFLDHDKTSWYYTAIGGATPEQAKKIRDQHNGLGKKAHFALSRDGRLYILVEAVQVDGFVLEHVQGWDFAAGNRIVYGS